MMEFRRENWPVADELNLAPERMRWNCAYEKEGFRQAGFNWQVLRSVIEMLNKLVSSDYITRLVTRTKECNTYASLRVSKTCRRNESEIPEGRREFAREGIRAVNLLTVLSKSICVATRKAVSYSSVEWSREKFWWRLEQVLTCKSFSKRWYSGERLIELSSSWFRPKFPSG